MIKADVDIGVENSDALVLVTEHEWTMLQQSYSAEAPTIVALIAKDSNGIVLDEVKLSPGKKKIVQMA